MKKKIRVLMISEKFPAYHSRAGELTNFEEKIKSGEKIHTIRPNYEIWKNWEKEINEGKAILSIRKWSGRPYWTSMVEIMQLDRIGVQPIDNLLFFDSDQTDTPLSDLSKNDGLSFEDLKKWFLGSKQELKAIIHFTGFRY
jgi:hypothetical protein